MTDGADAGLDRLREQHTRDKAITSICGECGWPFPCATVRLLDRLAALEGALRGLESFYGVDVLAEMGVTDAPEMAIWREARAALAGTPKP